MSSMRAHLPLPATVKGGRDHPDGKTAYVLDEGAVTPITTTNRAMPEIKLGGVPLAGVAFTPDSRYLYVATKRALIPVRTATSRRGKAVPLLGISNFAIAAPASLGSAGSSGHMTTTTPSGSPVDPRNARPGNRS